MLTQCPSCQTIFRITSEILRVAHGQVRCGRCHTQFDALERLVEENDVEQTGSGRFVKPEPQASEIEVEEPPAQEDITLEGRHIEITGTYRVMDDPDDPQIRQETVEEWVDLDEVDEEIAEEAVSDDGIEVTEQIEEEIYEAEEAPPEPEPDPVAARESEQDRFTRRLRSQRQRELRDAATDEELEAIAGQRAAVNTPLVWKILAAPLVIALIAQVMHHYRSDLARSPALGPAVVGIYGALGATLTPDWQLHAYEIKQWGVLSDPNQPGTLRVRASITNRAGYPQPYPLLKLVLEDRWGDQVRAREFEPAEYADPGTATNRLLTPGEAVNATVTIVDPGPDAEGFRFDACLKGNRQAVVCAAEVPR